MIRCHFKFELYCKDRYCNKTYGQTLLHNIWTTFTEKGIVVTGDCSNCGKRETYVYALKSIMKK